MIVAVNSLQMFIFLRDERFFFSVIKELKNHIFLLLHLGGNLARGRLF